MTTPSNPGANAVTIVIPAYNEAPTIAAVIERCRAVATAIIVVDDGSTDDTWHIVARHAVTALRLPANRGKATALLTGIEHALATGAERIVTLDADGQHRPEDIPRLLAAAGRQPDAIVMGSRRADGGRAPRARYCANRVADFGISWAAGRVIEDTQSGMRLYPAPVLRRLLPRIARSRGFVLESAILIHASRDGVPIVPVAIPALYGDVTRRASHFNPLRDIPKIAVMVAGKLLGSGLNPAGLWRVLSSRAEASASAQPASYERPIR